MRQIGKINFKNDPAIKINGSLIDIKELFNELNDHLSEINISLERIANVSQEFERRLKNHTFGLKRGA